jgi:hypothetical protein
VTVLFLLVSLAHADIVNPGEPVCDAVAKCGADEVVSCVYAYHGAPDPGCDAYTSLRVACDHGGATVSSREYCKPKEGAAAAPVAAAPVAEPTPAPTPAEPAKVDAPASKCASVDGAGAFAMGLALLIVGSRRKASR